MILKLLQSETSITAKQMIEPIQSETNSTGKQMVRQGSSDQVGSDHMITTSSPSSENLVAQSAVPQMLQQNPEL